MSKIFDEPKKDNGKVYALFQNLENQGASLSYAWEGQILTYQDGQVYLMSLEQIEHLNSLAVMSYENVPTPEGQIKSMPAGKRHRFSVRQVTQGEINKIKAEMKPASIV